MLFAIVQYFMYRRVRTVYMYIKKQNINRSGHNNSIEMIEKKVKNTSFWLELVSLSVASVVTVGMIVLLSLSSITSAGVKNSTGDVSNQYYTQITPADYAFLIWNVIFIWQALWLGYAWSFVFRPKAARTIAVSVYWAYTLANALNITWIYLWGNYFIGGALAVLVLINVLLYASLGLLSFYLHRYACNGMRTTSRRARADYWLTWALVVNGIGSYATWTTVASFVNLSAVLQYLAGLSAANSGTASLVLLTLTILAYFASENTVFDRFARYTLCVYPVVIWALIAVLVAHWSQDGHGRNAIYTLVLLIVVIALGILRIVLFVIFSIWRPVAN